MRVTLGDVCEKGSSNLKQSDVINKTGAYPIYGAAGYLGNVDFYHQDKPYVAVVKDGAGIGRTTLHPAKSSVIGTMQYLLPKNNVLPEYLYYVVQYMHLEKYFTGATIPHIYFKDYKAEPFNLDTIERQKEIVASLQKVETLIKVRQQQLQKLDELVKARFVELFGDPVANEKGWHVELLKDVCNGIGDGLHGTPEYDEVGAYPFINGNNLTNGTIEITPSTRMVNIETYINHYIEISDNAILLSINGTLGKLALYNREKVMLGKSACYCNLRPEINREFVYGVMRTNAFAEFLERNATASTIKNVGLKAIRNFRLIVPPDDLQTEFVTFSRRVDKSKVAVQKSLDEAQLLFDSLMQRYFE